MWSEVIMALIGVMNWIFASQTTIVLWGAAKGFSVALKGATQSQ